MLAAGALGACGANDGNSTIEHTHDACSPLALVSEAPTEVQTAGMRGGEQLWVDYGAPAIGRRSGTTLQVVFEEAAGAFRGLYDDQQVLIYINRGITDEATLSVVIAHELGHAFGLPHITDRPSVMNPGNLTIRPNADDRLAIEALWGACQ
jgi:hypothetical protein